MIAALSGRNGMRKCMGKYVVRGNGCFLSSQVSSAKREIEVVQCLRGLTEPATGRTIQSLGILQVTNDGTVRPAQNCYSNTHCVFRVSEFQRVQLRYSSISSSRGIRTEVRSERSQIVLHETAIDPIYCGFPLYQVIEQLQAKLKDLPWVADVSFDVESPKKYLNSMSMQDTALSKVGHIIGVSSCKGSFWASCSIPVSIEGDSLSMVIV